MAKVPVTDEILAEEDEVVGRLGGAAGISLVEARPRCDVDLAADDRLDPGTGGLEVELHGAEHVAMIGDGQRRHPTLLGALHQIADLDGAIEKAVLAVEMQMYETGVFHKEKA